MKINATQTYTQKRPAFKMNVQDSRYLGKAMFDTYLRHGAAKLSSTMGKLNTIEPEASLLVERSDKEGFLTAIVAFGKKLSQIEAPSADLLGQVVERFIPFLQKAQ